MAFGARRNLHEKSTPILRDCSRAGFAAWLGAEFTLDVLADVGPALPRDTEGGILRARFLATRIDAMETFYARTLGWETERRDGSLVVEAGGTELRFDPTPNDDAPYYHIAWAIPSNKLAAGKAWLAERTPILRHPDGRDEFHFRSARRSAVYFGDPAGNVLELIARHDVGDTASGGFDLGEMLYVNHVGLVVDDMDAAIRTIGDGLGLDPTAPPTPNFTKLGDSHRHVVLVPPKRLWLPEMNRGAEVFDADVVLHGPRERSLAFNDLPYRIEIRPE